MNISNLLNSRSIAEHWKEINYQPDSLETAWLIYFSRKLTFKEKCKYWEEIIKTMPDMEIRERVNCRHYDSLHDFLYRFMAVSKRFLDWFNDNTDCVYTLKDADDDYQFDAAFSSIDSVKEFIKAEECEYIKTFVIKKISVDDYHRYPASIKINKEFGAVCQEVWDYGTFPCDEEEYDILIAFKGMWFDFPVPFKKGDVIYNPFYNYGCAWKSKEITGLYVVKNVGLDCISENRKKGFLEGKSGDNTDMVFRGYTQWRDGTVYGADFWNYMDFELYNGEFNGEQRIIKALSNYEKGLIDGKLLMHAYHQILSEERVKNDFLDFYNHESLELAGINLHENDGIFSEH